MQTRSNPDTGKKIKIMAKAKTKKEASQSEIEGLDPLPAGMVNIPEVQPGNPMDIALSALESEVSEITQGRNPSSVVWQFELSDGRKGGSTMKFYQDCKENEIRTGTPCQFVRPISAPVNVALSGKMATIAPTAMKAAKKCPTCK